MPPLRHRLTPSPVGPLLLVADAGDHLCGLYLDGHRRGPAGPPGVSDGGGVLRVAIEQLDAYFAGERTAFDLPLQTGGTALQRRVWTALADIPYGTTTTYGALAMVVGLKPARAARAVGSANARNPISIVLPCHRVLGAHGALTGYAGGLAAKRALLEREGALPTRLSA